ncbi:DUF4249 domain-containing protein [Hymenobacter nivis]|uniref:DUF4249 domain-containing protein n=1 Tax=Hymenobacter nivis TaxID=1850093 RepID=A0A2Z3GPG9_9BACT|nr:DUF4249 domain-containing protein [Hymenobacter nivis]AWM34331.1 DUF4249 domain-containing protein [Hymenobacter nivis]
MLRLRKCFSGALAVALGAGLAGCVEPYAPDVISAPNSYLVVDGFVNLQGISTIRLSRTKGLNDPVPPPAETRATGYLQDDAGARYPLAELGAGTYASAFLYLSPARKYQLHLHTAAGRDYESDLVAAKLAPPIDNLSWDRDALGVHVQVSAHDATSATRYYRWTYVETWEFRSAYPSFLMYNPNTRVIEPRTEDIYHCWATAPSTTIPLGKTTALSQDVVANFPVVSLPENSAKLRIKYSVLVRQYAQTPEEYAYWEKLKKNTEDIGTLFDPLPTQLTGNVHCLQDAAEPVLGYVGATTVTERRLFIDNSSFPRSIKFQTGYETCVPPDTVRLSAAQSYFSSPTSLPLEELYNSRDGTLMGYSGASAGCVDCRLRGTNVKPSFWP